MNPIGAVVNGPLRHSYDDDAVSATVNRISIASLEELLISQYNQESIELSSEENTEMSTDDIMLLKIASEVFFHNGHYHLKILF